MGLLTKSDFTGDAVSPVIGVLMVAIWVILSAVITAFVFGMSQGYFESNQNQTVIQLLPTPDAITLAVFTDCEKRMVCVSNPAKFYGMSCFYNETELLKQYCPEIVEK